MLSFLDKIQYGTPRTRRVAFWITIIFTIYALFGFLAVPPIVNDVLTSQLTENLGRTARIQKIYFNPLALHLEIDGLEVDKLEGEGHLVSIGSLDVTPGISSIWRLAPVISDLKINDFKLDITFFGNGRYSISDLAGAKGQDPAASESNATEGSAIFPFALYDFEVSNATIVFDDRPRDKKHVISDLNLSIPFTSSFLNLQKEFTQPSFKAVVNGDPIELKGRTLPFDKSMRTEFELGAMDIDLCQYWRYVPLDTPLELVKGRFSSAISLIFERPDDHSVHLFLGGGGKLTDLALESPDDGQVCSLKQLSFEMEKYSLGDNLLVLTDVTMDSPYFKVVRHEDDSINWAGYFPGSEMAPPGPKVKSPAKEEASLLMDIRRLQVKSGTLDWMDRAIPGGFERTFADFNFTGTEISTKGDRPSRFEASIGKEAVFSLKGVGTVQPFGMNAELTGSGLSLPGFKPYIEHYLPLSPDSGKASFSANVDLRMDDDHARLKIDNAGLSMDKLSMRKPNATNPSLGFETFRVSGTSLDLDNHLVTVNEVRFKGPFVRLERTHEGLDLIQLFSAEEPPAKAIKPPTQPHIEPVAKPDGKEWEATVKAIRVEDAALSYKDATLKHPTNLDFDGLKLDLDNVTTRQGESMTYTMSAQWSGHGSIAVQGKASLTPLAAEGKLNLAGLALRPLNGHLADFSELQFASGTASADLKYSYKHGDSPKISLAGSTALNRVRLKGHQGEGEFASIEKFNLASVFFGTDPYRLTIGEIQLLKPSVSVDFDEQGHSNIRRAFRIPEPPPLPEGVETDQQEEQAQEAPKPEAEDPLFDKLDIGVFSIKDGHIRFRDASVKPYYHTEISSINLALMDISQSSDAHPKMDLRAVVGQAPIAVIGIFNPATTPIYSDLGISVSGVDLKTLTPYTIEYLAYPIEKGHLFADVKFKTADWELQADNKFYVKQLKLGPKDKRPNAPDVPVKFGLSLLQDSNGDVELDLPIRGRIDDPNFRIGGIVFKAISGLMFKALASPFSLIGSIFGGGDQEDSAGFILFGPGEDTLSPSAKQSLDTVVTAMEKRQRLKLEVNGVFDPATDRPGLVSVLFANKLKQQKYDSLPRSQRAETTVAEMFVSPEEYGEFLYEAYADEPDEDGIKPTTLFVTDRQPIEFMEKFILNQISVTSDDLKELAKRRAEAVKSYITETAPDLEPRTFVLDKSKNLGIKTGVPRHRADLGIR